MPEGWFILLIFVCGMGAGVALYLILQEQFSEWREWNEGYDAALEDYGIEEVDDQESEA